MKYTTLLLGFTIKLSNEAKYLGIVLDCRLYCNRYMQIKQTMHVEFSDSVAPPFNLHGVFLRASLWLYEAIIRLILSNRTLVWWPRT